MLDEIQGEDFKLEKDLKLKDEFSPPTFEEWKAKVEQDLKGASFEKKLLTKTYEGITLNPIYTKEDLENVKVLDQFPSEDNMKRGINASGYHESSWDVNQEIFEQDASEYNEALVEALNNGQNSVNILLDTATRLGVDADYAEEWQVGDKGLSISAINSVKRALNNIDLTKYPIYVDTGFNAVPFLSLINAHIKANNIDVSAVKGSITADPIAHLAVYGELPVKIDFVFDMMKTTLDWVSKSSSKLRTIGISTLPFVNSGSNVVQELAYAISTLVFYINELAERNVNVKTILNNVQFTLGISNNYFMEIAKFRAVRVLLNNIAELYEINSEEVDFNIGAKSTSFTQTKLDPYVNMLRSTTQSFSAILGGINNLTTAPFDESIRKPDSFSRRIARNTQTILREESHLDQVIDPAGGSYFIESLTEQLAESAWELFKQIENDGGILESLKNDSIKTQINEIVELRKKDINKRKSVIVGSNMFADVKEKSLETEPFNQAAFKAKRAEYLEKYRLNGDAEKHQLVMDKLNSISTINNAEVIDKITEAYLLGTTIGEVSSVLHSSNKEKLVIEKITPVRASEDFEALRALAKTFADKNGELPTVYLANYGSLKEYKARADFSKGFFEAGGFSVIDPKGSNDIEGIVNEAVGSNAPIIVVCSTDDNYPAIVPQIVKGIKEKDSGRQLVLAGYPKDQIEDHKNSGIDEFIFLGADVMKILSTLYTRIGGQK